MMMQEHLIVPSEGGTNSTGTSSSPLENSNRVALNVSFSTMSATVGSPPPPSNHGHIQGNDHQHPNINHHIHHNSDGPPSDTRYGIFGEKMENFPGIGPGMGGAASASSDASSSSSSGGSALWQSHHPSGPPIPNNPPHMTHLPNENDDLKLSQGTGMIQRCGSNNSSGATVGHLNGHPDILPPGYIEHHQKQLELAAASATGDANSPGASSPGGASSCGGVMGVTSLLSSPPDIINNSVGNPPSGGNSQSKKSSSRRNAWGNLSYADLITQAIKNSPDQRLTLSQVYEWMVANIPYFKDKGDSNSSAGWKNSIRHNLSLHSRFVRVQNEGTGKSSWWMMNPDAKAGSGKNSRRRTPSVDTAVGGPGSNGGSGGVGGRGPDFKRRGRTKKNSLGVGGLIPGHIRNGGPSNNRIGNESLPSPGVATSLGMVSGGPGGLYDLNPDSPAGGPGMLHHHPPYPFSDMRGHPNVGPPDFPVPIGGRISPPGPMRIGGEGNNVPQFNYPGQEWSAEYSPCGPMTGYFPGSMPRGYGEPICSEPSGNEYPRPMSPLHPYPNRTANGFSYRPGPLIPNGNNHGAPMFPSQQHNEITFNHTPQQQIFNSGSHENKLPNSPSNTTGIHTMDSVNRSGSGQPHSYSNSQSVASPNGQVNRPISFPSPNIEHSSQNPISTTSSSSRSVETPGHVAGSHLSPIGHRPTAGDGFYSQPTGTEDNGNDTNSLCRPSSKTLDTADIAGQNTEDSADQQGSILEKALAKQDQSLLTTQPSPLTNNSSLDWTPANAETQQLNRSGGGNGYGNGVPDSREFMMKQEIESSTIGDYMQHYHHHGHHHPNPNGPTHDPITNTHHQVYANSATLHIPAGNEDHHLIRHSSPTVAAGADQYHSSSKHHHAPPWVR